jgi:predicted component of type VI protein secretion system
MSESLAYRDGHRLAAGPGPGPAGPVTRMVPGSLADSLRLAAAAAGQAPAAQAEAQARIV